MFLAVLSLGIAPCAPPSGRTVYELVTPSPQKIIFQPFSFQSLAHSLAQRVFDKPFAISLFRTLCPNMGGGYTPQDSHRVFKSLRTLFLATQNHIHTYLFCSRASLPALAVSSLYSLETHGPYRKLHILLLLIVKRAQFPALWYTFVALNTAVVLCGSSGFVPDLRTPALRSSVRFQRNSKEDWQRKTRRVSTKIRVHAAIAPARKLNAKFFRTIDFSLCKGAAVVSSFFDAHSRSSRGDSARAGR
jgi:hypothetical protein